MDELMEEAEKTPKVTDKDLTKMSMEQSATTLAEVWDNEEDEIWNTL